ncbi:unnamed protein product [Aphanomyces euteiches]|nr:hypothetical protein Ae201684P_021503 [Aphanomyces euteiches]
MTINSADAPIFTSAYYVISTALHTNPLSQTTFEITVSTGETIKATVSLTANKCTEQFQGGSASTTPTFAPTVPLAAAPIAHATERSARSENQQCYKPTKPCNHNQA